MEATLGKYLIDRSGQLAVCKEINDLFANCLSSILPQKQRGIKFKN
jgi:hypothetical protein